MSLLSRKSFFAIAAVIDIALHSNGRPVSAKGLAARHDLRPRHLEPVLQALVRQGVLRGIRGPHGGYELARDRRRISVDDILRAVDSTDDEGRTLRTRSTLIDQVVVPAVAKAERAFSVALARISLDDLVRRAELAARRS